MDSFQSKLDEAIRDVWKMMKAEYDNGWLRRESSLVNSFYFHLRQHLGDHFFVHNNLRIYSNHGFHALGEKSTSDLTIVKANEEYYDDEATQILVLMEFKYKSGSSLEDFYSDVRKIGRLVKKPFLSNTLFYFATIHEDYWPTVEESSWLDGRQKRWAKGKLTELNGFLDEENGELVIKIIKH